MMRAIHFALVIVEALRCDPSPTIAVQDTTHCHFPLIQASTIELMCWTDLGAQPRLKGVSIVSEVEEEDALWRITVEVPNKQGFVEVFDTAENSLGKIHISQEPLRRLTIFEFSDFHGRLSARESEAVPGRQVGAVALAAALDRQRRLLTDTHEDYIVISAGDNIGASSFESRAQKDRPTEDFLMLLNITASAVGNHDFDFGPSRVLESPYPMLAANILGSDGQPLVPASMEIEGPNSKIKVKIEAATTQAVKDLSSPGLIDDLEFLAPAKALSPMKDPHRILIVHSGAPNGPEFNDILNLAKSTEALALFAGHTHQVMKSNKKGPTILQAGSYGEYLSRLYIYQQGDIIWTEGDVFFAGHTDTPHTDTPRTLSPLVSSVKQLVDAAEKAVGGGEELGYLCRALRPQPRSVESITANFVADAYRNAGDGDVAFVNPGAIRDKLGPGKVTALQVENALPFDGPLVRLHLTGRTLKEVLREQLSHRRLMLGVSGINYDFEEPRKLLRGGNPGLEIMRVWLQKDKSATEDQSMDDQAAVETSTALVEDDKIYHVIVNGFLATGGDHFRSLRQAEKQEVLKVSETEALKHFLLSGGDVDDRHRAINVTCDF